MHFHFPETVNVSKSRGQLSDLSLQNYSPNHRQSETMQWRMQDFPEGGTPSPKGRAATHYLTKFSRKLHGNKEILARGWEHPLRPLDPPL